MSDINLEHKKNIICDCTGTTQAKIESLIAQGKKTVDEIASATGAGTGCGSCDVLIHEIVNHASMLPLKRPKEVDVLCLGHACYDLIFSVDHHPIADEKMTATGFAECGGGPAANAAVAVAKLGLKAAFSGYLGNDNQGESHYQELLQYGVNTQWIQRGKSPTPISTILAKPNGERSLVNYKGATKPLAAKSIDFSSVNPKVILFDGHQPYESIALIKHFKNQNIPMILDAGSVHEGTLALMNKVDYLICSEKFSRQQHQTLDKALEKLSKFSPAVVITLGSKGLIWQRGLETGSLVAYSVNAIDSTGAGDAFHGAFAAALVFKKSWLECLSYASAAGALCCTKMGARFGLPSQKKIETFLLQ
jgi:sulfofructose kinase